jgi:orotate phosphoribosyltransferase
MRTMYEDQITSGKSSIEEFKKSDISGLNEADLALVVKYKAQIDEATKRFKQKQGN